MTDPMAGPATADARTVARLLDENRYMVLGTVGQDGMPWVSPVFFACVEDEELCWVSSRDSRHSRNLEVRPAVAVTVFDSTVAVGRAEAAYFEADAASVTSSAQRNAVREALNARLPAEKRLEVDDLAPRGPMTAYRARIRTRYLLVRGGDPTNRNAHDITVAVTLSAPGG